MRVTVGISFHNDETTLGAAIQSVFAQSIPDWELILTDDGSTDGSLEIARSVRDPRVRVVCDGQNLGLAARLNQITRMAKGGYIARMDADDLMHPARLASQAEYLDRHAEVDVVGSSCVLVDAATRVVGLGSTAPLDLRSASVLRKVVLLHPSCMGRREWFRRHPYDERLRRGQDAELWIRTHESSVFARIERPLLFYRAMGSGGRRAFLAKSLRGIAQHLGTVARYGPGLVGRLRTALLMLRIGLFTVVLTPFALFHRPEALIHRASPPVGARERKAAEAALAAIRRTRVPGLTVSRSEAGVP